jgi:PAS domain S-box-containing protein
MSNLGESYIDETLNDLSDYFHGAPIGLKATSSDGTITRTNLAELKLLGYDAHEDEYVGHHLAEFHADPNAVQALLDRLVTGERVTEYEATLLRRDGSPQRVLMYANARIADGEFRGIRCFTFPHPEDLRPDIAEVAALTDQSIESRGLRLSIEERDELYGDLRDFFDNGPVNLHIVGSDGLIKHANKSELAAMGYAAETYLGQHIARFHADQKVIDGMLEDLVGGTPLINFSATLFNRDGSKMPVMIYSNSRMRNGSFVNTRCFTVAVPKSRQALPTPIEFGWPRNEDFGFTIPGRTAAGKPNPMTVALKYIASRKRPEESLGFLAEVSRALGAKRSLQTMLDDVAKLAVPFLADVVSIETSTARLAFASIPSLHLHIAKILSCAPDRAREVRAWFDLRTVPEPRAGQLLALRIASAIEVPLAIRGDHVGTLVLLRPAEDARRMFGPADRALAEELARRISFAIEIDRLIAHS